MLGSGGCPEQKGSLLDAGACLSGWPCLAFCAPCRWWSRTTTLTPPLPRRLSPRRILCLLRLLCGLPSVFTWVWLFYPVLMTAVSEKGPVSTLPPAIISGGPSILFGLGGASPLLWLFLKVSLTILIYVYLFFQIQTHSFRVKTLRST